MQIIKHEKVVGTDLAAFETELNNVLEANKGNKYDMQIWKRTTSVTIYYATIFFYDVRECCTSHVKVFSDPLPDNLDGVMSLVNSINPCRFKVHKMNDEVHFFLEYKVTPEL